MSLLNAPFFLFILLWLCSSVRERSKWTVNRWRTEGEWYENRYISKVVKEFIYQFSMLLFFYLFYCDCVHQWDRSKWTINKWMSEGKDYLRYFCGVNFKYISIIITSLRRTELFIISKVTKTRNREIALIIKIITIKR